MQGEWLGRAMLTPWLLQFLPSFAVGRRDRGSPRQMLRPSLSSPAVICRGNLQTSFTPQCVTGVRAGERCLS